MTTPDQLGQDTRVAADPAARSRRDFWRFRPQARPASWLRVFREAMACRVEVLLPADAAGDVACAREALAEADRIEAAWSVFRGDSQLTRINRAAATAPCQVDPELWRLLDRCRSLTRATEGAFDITATPLSRCWRLLTREGAVPTPEALAGARACTGMGLVELTGADEEPGGTVRFAREGVELNLGAIGKGYAVGRIAARLRAAGVRQALVSAGDSSIEAVGAPAGGWPISLRGHAAGVRLWLRHGTVATSGAGEQGFVSGGARLGHVLDPRTGWPARGVARVAVVAPDAADADALATAFLVGGPGLAERYLAAHDDVLAVFTLDVAPRPHIMGRDSCASVEG